MGLSPEWSFRIREDLLKSLEKEGRAICMRSGADPRGGAMIRYHYPNNQDRGTGTQCVRKPDLKTMLTWE